MWQVNLTGLFHPLEYMSLCEGGYTLIAGQYLQYWADNWCGGCPAFQRQSIQPVRMNKIPVGMSIM